MVLNLLRRWAVASQQTACHNAMVAGTAIAERRTESSEVAAYVADVLAARAVARAG
jgi:hypothetical protein